MAVFKYRVSVFGYDIEKLEILKENDELYWFTTKPKDSKEEDYGSRFPKNCYPFIYFDSFDEAKKYLKKGVREYINSLKYQIREQRKELKKVDKLTESQ